jgi:hypothetical protein
MKTVYQLDRDGVYLGETIAQESPLEPGVFLMPAGCIEHAPPPVKAGKFARWDEGWIVEDIPKPPKPEEPPEPTAEQRAASIRAQRNYLLSLSDWTQVADAPVDRTSWVLYRKALRDITDQATFPASVDWPKIPM